LTKAGALAPQPFKATPLGITNQFATDALVGQQVALDTRVDFQVEAIVDERGKGANTEYKVKWTGQPRGTKPEWLPLTSFLDKKTGKNTSANAFAAYNAKKKTKKSRPPK
jgi:hypothetical protein